MVKFAAPVAEVREQVVNLCRAVEADAYLNRIPSVVKRVQSGGERPGDQPYAPGNAVACTRQPSGSFGTRASARCSAAVAVEATISRCSR